METNNTPLNRLARRTIKQIELSALDYLANVYEESKKSQPYLHIRSADQTHQHAVWELYPEQSYVKFAHLSIANFHMHSETSTIGERKGEIETYSSTVISFDSREPDRRFNAKSSLIINHYENGEQLARMMSVDETHPREREVPITRVLQFNELFRAAATLFQLQETQTWPDAIVLDAPYQIDEPYIEELTAAA